MHTARNNLIRDKVSDLVSSILSQNGITARVEPDARLGDVGMTSMDMVGLMLGVEAAFDIAIPQAEITAENFQSVTAIERLVMRQFNEKRAAEPLLLRAVA